MEGWGRRRWGAFEVTRINNPKFELHLTRGIATKKSCAHSLVLLARCPPPIGGGGATVVTPLPALASLPGSLSHEAIAMRESLVAAMFKLMAHKRLDRRVLALRRSGVRPEAYARTVAACLVSFRCRLRREVSRFERFHLKLARAVEAEAVPETEKDTETKPTPGNASGRLMQSLARSLACVAEQHASSRHALGSRIGTRGVA